MLAADVRLDLAQEFLAQSPRWRLVSDQVRAAMPEAASTPNADLAATTAELTARLDRMERLLRAEDEARYAIGANFGPHLIDTARPVAEAKQAIAEGNSEAAKSALTKFKELLPSLAQGVAIEIGREIVQDVSPYVKPLALWAFNEIHQIIVLLQRWIDLM